ncbi:MAG: Fe-S protein assembly co-chaperone HscB [Azoarcus sp.]|jgi:molecular chaperone HscB|nr:Fe-S protein assembly co-chaperone HscB [Azoarcus sp.]
MTVDLSLNYFALFGLPCQFNIDETALDCAWHALQAEVHPDRHAHQPDDVRRAAMQQATRVNEAYATLKKPLARAQYLLELAGGIDAQRLNANTVASEYLFEQLEWREAVEETRRANDADGLEQLALRLQIQTDAILTQLAEQLGPRRDFNAAADTTQRLMFLDKLRRQIDDALAAIDT